jgi:hypothetical protein
VRFAGGISARYRRCSRQACSALELVVVVVVVVVVSTLV